MTTDEGRAAIVKAAYRVLADDLVDGTKGNVNLNLAIDATIALARAEGARIDLLALLPYSESGKRVHRDGTCVGDDLGIVPLGIIAEHLARAEAEVNACQDRLREASG